MMRVSVLPIMLVAFVIVSFQKEKKFVPPGTIMITDTLYFDTEEVTCLAWCEYQYWTKNMYGGNSEQYKATIIDTTNWDSPAAAKIWCAYKPLLMEQRNLPVAGITHAQAKAYCQWRTQRVNYFLALRKHAKSYNFEYRLPSEQEWEFVSDGSGEVFSIDNKNKPMAQLKNGVGTTSQATVVASFEKNSMGLSDLTGNVAEMVLQEHIAKGGSWSHTVDESRNGKQQIYQKAAPWLGFRCVCIVKKKF
jgi:formylglycine-generating enzyme required for sulfatase activity